MYGIFTLPGTKFEERGGGVLEVYSGQRVGLRNTVPPESGQLCVERLEAGVPVLKFSEDGAHASANAVLDTVLGREVEGFRVGYVSSLRDVT